MNLIRPAASYVFFVSLICLVLGSGCGMFTKIGRDVVGGASEKTDTLARNLVKGLREELADPETKKQIRILLDSITTALDSSLQPKVKGMVNTVINHKILLWADSLVEKLTGKKFQLNMKAVQYTLVGKSKADVLQIRNSFKELFEEIISDNTTNKLGKMRDELLGAKTDSALSLIVDHATKKFIDRYKSDMDPALKGDVSFIRKNATTLLIVMGAIAAVIIFLVWWSRRRYLKLVTLLTKHIHSIPDQKVYDTVTAKIKDDAVSAGLEPDLRKILKENGLIGDNNWDKKVNK